MKALIVFVGFVFFAGSEISFAAETNKTLQAPKVERIGGTFTVKSIKAAKDGFRVTFVANEGSPRFKTLVLDSPHVHMSLTEGASLRLSADVIATSGSTADVSQVVVFVPGKTGDTPIWMLSRRAVEPVPPAKLIEMHAPQTDYQVF